MAGTVDSAKREGAMSVTIKDIAREAGVSYSTVSRALNGLDIVNAKTKAHILRTAKNMGYMPNPSAVNLKRNRTFMLGVYFSSINAMSSPEVLHEVVTAIYDVTKENYLLVVKGVDHHIPGTLNPAVFDGIINVTSRQSDEEFLKEALSKKIPTVVLNRKANIPVDTVLTDEEDSIYRTMHYLLDHGHRRIVVLEGPRNLPSTTQRHAGWVRAVKEMHLDPEQFPVVEGNYRYESGERLAPKIMQYNPTAILSFNDEMAFGVERVLLGQGIHVPKDVSIIGFDNWNQPMYTSMDLTTIERSMYNIAHEACELLLTRIESEERTYATKTIYLDAPLIERGSVRSVSGQIPYKPSELQTLATM